MTSELRTARGCLAAVFFILTLATGCTATAPVAPPALPAGIPPRVELAQVPFFAQTQYQCGPAALAMVLAHSGLEVTPADLVAMVYAPARRGSLTSDLVGATRRQGRLAYPVDRLGDLLREVAAGHPAVVLQRLGPLWDRRWHYAVLIGYDLDSARVILRSGTEARVSQSLADFARSWEPGGRFALIALVPGRLPASALPAPYLAAVAGLERTGFAAEAVAAYAAARAHWPESAPAATRLDHARAALGDRVGAAAAFAEAARPAPDSTAPRDDPAPQRRAPRRRGL